MLFSGFLTESDIFLITRNTRQSDTSLSHKTFLWISLRQAQTIFIDFCTQIYPKLLLLRLKFHLYIQEDTRNLKSLNPQNNYQNRICKSLEKCSVCRHFSHTNMFVGRLLISSIYSPMSSHLLLLGLNLFSVKWMRAEFVLLRSSSVPPFIAQLTS